MMENENSAISGRVHNLLVLLILASSVFGRQADSLMVARYRPDTVLIASVSGASSLAATSSIAVIRLTVVLDPNLFLLIATLKLQRNENLQRNVWI